MEKVYVIGHKNPDTDSICSSFCYAKLKNAIDKDKEYIAARCGNLNKQTSFIFNNLSLEPPVFIKDVYPKVQDVMTKDVVSLSEESPLFDVMDDIKRRNIRLTPIVDENNMLKGIVSILEISDFFISDSVNQKPKYLFDMYNFERVLQGYFYLKGNYRYFEAQIIVGAMPFETFKTYVDKFDFSKIIIIVGKRMKILNYAVKNNVAAIILTGLSGIHNIEGIDFSNYEGCVFVSPFDTAETARRLSLSIPVSQLMHKSTQTVQRNDYLDYAKELMISNSNRGLPVVEDGKLVGIITRSDIIKRYAQKLILMDHNEMSQAVDGVESAQIIEIVDHHRLGVIKTNNPIFFYAKPVGSTCSLVAQLYKTNNISIDRTTALLLLSGIISDTIMLKSPTTTLEDIAIIDKLSKIAGVDVTEYGNEIFASADSLSSMNVYDIINTDFKVYDEYGVKFGIGQMEIVNIEEVEEKKGNILNELKSEKKNKGLDWTMLLVTDIVKSDSILLTSGFACENMLPYKKICENEYYLQGVLSRKKQLLPNILNVLEEFSSHFK